MTRMLRTASTALVALAALALAPPVSANGPHGDKTVRVDCAQGKSINRALRHGDERKPLVVIVEGTCTENVVVERDDVTLQGEPGATIVAADASKPTLSLDGAHRVVVTGLTLSGGRDGIAATRGSTLEVGVCVLQNNARFGLIVSYGGTAAVDNCVIQNNGGGGAVAANGAQLVVTNSTVRNNTGNGLAAVRNSHLRVGQDTAGSLTPGPVTVQGNTQGGIVVSDASAGIVVATRVEANGGHGIVSQSSSSVSIGVGTLGLVAPVTIRGNGNSGVSIYQASRGLVQDSLVKNNTRDGVRIEGSAATVIGSQIRGNGRYGIASLNSGSARIGLADSPTGTSGNTIENNVLEGVHLVGASSAWMFGNLIQGNGTTNARFGILAVEGSAVRFVGLNTITGNGSIAGTVVGGGVFLRASGLYVMKGDFDITPNTNTISGNTGDGVQAIENSTVELRDGMTVSGNTRNGVFLIHGGRMRSQGTTVSGNAANAIELLFGSTVRFGPTPSTVNGTIACDDAESSVAAPPATVLGTPAFGAGCTGF